MKKIINFKTIKIFQKKAILFLLTFVLIVIIAFIYIENNTRRVILDYAESRAISISINAINTAVNKTLISKYDYNDFINVEKDNNGRITLLQADTIIMNQMSEVVSSAAQDELQDIAPQKIAIALGTILGSDLLAGKGPKFLVEVQPLGNVISNFITEFQTSGINQTHHRVYIEVVVDLVLIMPAGNRSVSVKQQLLVAESVIVGEVPQTFMSVNEVGKGLYFVPVN